MRINPDNQLANKDLNTKAALDAKGNASKRVVQTFLYSLVVGLVKPSNPIIDYLGQPFLLEFCFGVLSYGFVKSARTECVPRWCWLALSSVSLALMPAYFYLYGLPAFALVTSLIAIEISGGVARSRFIARLGAASYAIYLLHPYVVGILKKLLTMQPDPSSWRGVAMAFIVIAAVCVVGDICHVLIENPMLARLDRLFRQPKTGLPRIV